jgi:hypothetical protein
MLIPLGLVIFSQNFFSHNIFSFSLRCYRPFKFRKASFWHIRTQTDSCNGLKKDSNNKDINYVHVMFVMQVLHKDKLRKVWLNLDKHLMRN